MKEPVIFNVSAKIDCGNKKSLVVRICRVAKLISESQVDSRLSERARMRLLKACGKN